MQAGRAPRRLRHAGLGRAGEPPIRWADIDPRGRTFPAHPNLRDSVVRCSLAGSRYPVADHPRVIGAAPKLVVRRTGKASATGNYRKTARGVTSRYPYLSTQQSSSSHSGTMGEGKDPIFFAVSNLRGRRLRGDREILADLKSAGRRPGRMVSLKK
jgi:hypothetical protein